MFFKQNRASEINILLTGGHAATTALAIIEEIKVVKPEADIHWIGSLTALSGSKVTTLEYKLYPKLGVKYHEIKSGKLQTKFTRYTIPLLLMIPIGFFQAFHLLLKIKPKVILSFGGSASYPVAFWGYMLGIPVILHEQTMAAGRAARLSAVFCRRVAVSREASLKYFNSKKTEITGNPLTSAILNMPPKTEMSGNKTLLVMGGSRGSEFINEEIFKLLPELSQKYSVIHITGERDFPKYKNINYKNYSVLAYAEPEEMSDIYKKADVIVSRSGANSVSEILYLKRPSIFIPLPRTYLDEQYKNAEYAVKTGLARLLTETDCEKGRLMPQIDDVFENWQKIYKNAESFVSPDIDAKKRVAAILFRYI
jgi:UDP-N-acetylglucosamine--N-acetylmuramyl-(pentapeptide) pyrophosphoryl-undecaprenol N-acetylglucosamine transferase